MRGKVLLVAFLVAAALPAGAAGDDTPPKTTITSGPAPLVNTSTATFSFTADMNDVRFWCALDGPDFSRCTSPQTFTGIADGAHTFVVFATKGGEREDPPVSWIWSVDTTPPTVADARAAVGYRRMLLSWTPSADTNRVVVLRTMRKNKPPHIQVYSGAGRRYSDNRFDNSGYHRYSITAYDGAGNVSSSVEVTVASSALLLSPLDGASVRAKRPPVMRWRKAPRARYYNVQLWKGGRKVLSAWPLSTRFALKRTWTFEGRRYRLRRGAYTWYVWPSFRPYPQVAYGPLLGQASFKVS